MSDRACPRKRAASPGSHIAPPLATWFNRAGPNPTMAHRAAPPDSHVHYLQYLHGSETNDQSNSGMAATVTVNHSLSRRLWIELSTSEVRAERLWPAMQILTTVCRATWLICSRAPGANRTWRPAGTRDSSPWPLLPSHGRDIELSNCTSRLRICKL
jgi:hypothetical protein